MGSLVHDAIRVVASPRKFFAPESIDNVRAPRRVYAMAIAGGAIGSSICDAAETGAFDLVAAAASVLGQFIAAFPILYVVAGWHHLAARIVLPGRVSFGQSLTVVGYAGVPATIGWSLWLELAAGAWSLALIALGFATLRKVSWTRGALSPLVAVVLPLSTLFGLRTFVIEAFRVPTGGMMPTLMPEDHVFIGKADFVLDGTVPAYGDIVVYEASASDSESLPAHSIHRVVGLPGDTVEIRNNDLVVNGWIAPRCSVGVYQSDYGTHTVSVEYLGTQPFLVAHAQDEPSEDWGPFTVPSNQVFLLGDNRLQSFDSRAQSNGSGGGTDIGRIRGRALSIWYPFARMAKLTGSSLSLPRNAPELGKPLHQCLERGPALTLPPSSRPPT